MGPPPHAPNIGAPSDFGGAPVQPQPTVAPAANRTLRWTASAPAAARVATRARGIGVRGGTRTFGGGRGCTNIFSGLGGGVLDVSCSPHPPAAYRLNWLRNLFTPGGDMISFMTHSDIHYVVKGAQNLSCHGGWRLTFWLTFRGQWERPRNAAQNRGPPKGACLRAHWLADFEVHEPLRGAPCAGWTGDNRRHCLQYKYRSYR